MHNDAADAVSRAIRRLIVDDPFYASIMLRLRRVEDPSCKTGWVDGITYGYNPEFILGLSKEERVIHLEHECTHVACLHPFRQGPRDNETWNKSADYVVNGMLKEAGRTLRPTMLHEPAFKDKSAEEVYSILKQSQQDQGKEPGDQEPGDGEEQPDGKGGPGQDQGNQGGDGQGQEESSGDGDGWGEVRPAPAKSEAEASKMEHDVKVMVAQAANAAKKAGKVPGWMERLLGTLKEPRIHWKEVLARFLDERAKNDYSWSRPNARYAGTGFVLPSLDSRTVGTIVTMVDTSASMTQQQIEECVSEVFGVLEMYEEGGQEPTMRVMYVDTELAGEEMLEPGDIPHPMGGGGTCFRPGFEKLEEEGEDPKAVIYFTDGECWTFPDEPDFPVLWMVNGHDRSFAPPFGETCFLADV